MFERRHDALLPRPVFLSRLVRHALGACALLVVGLGTGMAGYHGLEGLSWLDSFLNAAMILGGMGPVDALHTPGGKLFAGLYAMFSGILFLVVAGVALAPVVHRTMHRFHLADEDSGS